MITKLPYQTSQPLETNIKPKSSFNKNLIIVAAIIGLITFIIISIKILSTDLSPEEQKSGIPSPTPIEITTINTYYPSAKLITKDGETFFAGEITEKEKTFLQIRGEKETIKILVRGDLYFREIPRIITAANTDSIGKSTQTINYDSLQKGDLISVTIKYEGESLIAVRGLIFK